MTYRSCRNRMSTVSRMRCNMRHASKAYVREIRGMSKGHGSMSIVEGSWNPYSSVGRGRLRRGQHRQIQPSCSSEHLRDAAGAVREHLDGTDASDARDV